MTYKDRNTEYPADNVSEQQNTMEILKSDIKKLMLTRDVIGNPNYSYALKKLELSLVSNGPSNKLIKSVRGKLERFKHDLQFSRFK
jgi:hypothetical protein